ncbi:hypothetical protein VKT23_001572 [Stygiomarasmius scandens]|uniref:DUF6535 domain-containing protein n=1 Tax=Marasmiellus scandens TaxID=2682957 RepID=A0ABR1K4U2_9AGAR
MSNGTTAEFQSLPEDKPATSSIICNALWFLSLALALTCSLLATFVQQWTRDFIHKTTLRPSPVRHARMLAFMYFGMRDFGMHTFVDMIPILLHVSLVFFFTGLVSFLIPVNRPLAYLMATILVIFLAIYIGLTCLPLLYLNAPYRTPFSSVLWRLGNNIGSLLARRHELSKQELSLTEAMLDESVLNTVERDQQALVYTVNSLTDDEELLPFIEAIPDAVYGPSGVRVANREMLMPLLHSLDPDVNIISRIGELIQKASHWTDRDHPDPSEPACSRALWSLALMLIQEPQPQVQLERSNSRVYFFDSKVISLLLSSHHLRREYVLSAVAAINLSRMLNLKYCVGMITRMLSSTDNPRHLLERVLLAKTIWRGVDLANSRLPHYPYIHSHCNEMSDLLYRASTSVEEYISDIREILSQLESDKCWIVSRLYILVHYLGYCSRERILPHELDVMCKTILPHLAVEVSDQEWIDTCNSFIRNYDSINPNLNSLTDELMFHWMRVIFSMRQTLSDHPFSAGCRKRVLDYLSRRIVDKEAVRNLWGRCELELLGSVHLSPGQNAIQACILKDLQVDVDHRDISLKAIWVLAISLCEPRDDGFVKWFQPPALREAHFKFAQDAIFPSVKTLLDSISCAEYMSAPVFYLKKSNHRALIQTILIEYLPELGRVPVPDSQQRALWTFGQYFTTSLYTAVLSRFISISCNNKAANHLDACRIVFHYLYNYQGDIHESSQVLFARSVSQLTDTVISAQFEPVHLSEVLDAVWGISPSWTWITSRTCAHIIAQAINRYKNSVEIAYNEGSERLRSRCEEVLGARPELAILNPDALVEFPLSAQMLGIPATPVSGSAPNRTNTL